MGLAQESFHASLLGIKTLAECYAVLGETGAARKTLSDYFDMVLQCNVRAAAEKARLVEFSGSVLPQEPWETFIKVHPIVRDRLHLFRATNSGKQYSDIEIEFMPLELQGDVDGNLP
jgi:hypothetical protein